METIKLNLIGSGAVGKTSIKMSYMERPFSREYLATLGADFNIKEVEYNNEKIRIFIWDLAGQSRYNQMRRTFYMDSKAYMAVYDISSPISFNNVIDYIKEAWKWTGPKHTLLIANKSDLSGKNYLTYNDGKKLLDLLKSISEINNIKLDFIETSAKTGKNIEKAFIRIMDMCLN